MFGGKKYSEKEVEELTSDLQEKLKTYKSLIADYERSSKDLTERQQREIEGIRFTHKLAMEQKEFDMKHHKDNELKKAVDEKIALEKKVAVLEAENKMLNKITDLNGDVLDVKELVTGLINKLPTIDLKSLTVQTSTASK